MNKYLGLAVTSFIAGAAILIFEIMSGNSEVYLFLIFPVIKSGSLLSLLGILMIFISFVLFFYAFFQGYGYKAGGSNLKTEIRSGGVVFIGPIPIIFSGDKKYLPYILIASVVIFIIMILFILYYK